MAKLVSPQSIATAASAAAVKLVGEESAIMRSTLSFSLSLLAYVYLRTPICGCCCDERRQLGGPCGSCARREQ